MNAVTKVSELPLKGKLDLTKYRKMMSYPLWNFVSQAVVETRSYELGLNAGLQLIRFTEERRAELTDHEYRSNLIQLYSFTLAMLDKLDKWEDYIDTWESLRANTNLALTYIRNAKQTHGARIEPFIVGEDDYTLYVHFLWGSQHRKEMIERKLELRRRRATLGNRRHRPKEELTPQEIRRRLRRIADRMRYAQQIRQVMDWVVQSSKHRRTGPV